MRRYDRDDNGNKRKLRVKIKGEGILDREFRHKGEAIDYLRKEGYDKDFIKKYVEFING